MSWKTNTIVVRPALLGADPDEFLGRLGYEKRRKSKEVLLAESGGASIWIGAISDRIIVYTPLAGHFFDGCVDGPVDQDFSFLRSALFRHFPEADIAAFFLDSRVGAWGFAVFRRGALIRRFYGHDGTIIGDEGSQLPAENAYLANCDRVEVDGEILYRSRSDLGDEPLSLADHGEGLFCEVWRSFTGYGFDAPELLQIPGSDFWLNDDEDEFLARRRRPWWKFWG
ncbi:DUF6928 family protein [Nitrobacter sp. TKz-YC02]|uniref:DUF6928 family protein n=1 Tax=Nitrobacter sp. TKz-YC02 TaxID=3398704 RepID=UPI003CF78C49